MPFEKMKKLKIKYAFLILIGLSFFSCSAQTESENLENSIIKVVKAFQEKDELTLNQLISKEKGLITLFRRGVFDQYKKTDKIDFKNPVPEYLPFFDFSTDFKVTFENLPTFDCDDAKWSKAGIYCDTINTDNLLSNTAKNLKKYRNNNISPKEIKTFEQIEMNSHRIVLSDKNDGELIFYLTLINKKWHLTIIDRVSSDCSA